MKLVLSPAKSLELSKEIQCNLATEPLLNVEKTPIVDKLKKMKPSQIASTFSLSTKLAQLNYERYQALGSRDNLENTRQAIYTFDGDVYVGFDAYSLDKKNFEYTQKTVRILSGLYGILKPFDLIEPYRLEMGSDISIQRKKNLYEFWSDKVTHALNNDLEDEKKNSQKVLINLASNEYFKVIQPKKLNAKIIQVDFLEEDKKELKNISFFSKKARGLMARYIVDNKIEKVEELIDFNYERYSFYPKLSTEDKWVFTRKYQLKGK